MDCMGFPGDSVVKKLPAKHGDLGLGLGTKELQTIELKHPVLLFTSTYLPVLMFQWLKGLELKNQVPVRQSKSEQTFDSFTMRGR